MNQEIPTTVTDFRDNVFPLLLYKLFLQNCKYFVCGSCQKFPCFYSVVMDNPQLDSPTFTAWSIRSGGKFSAGTLWPAFLSRAKKIFMIMENSPIKVVPWHRVGGRAIYPDWTLSWRLWEWTTGILPQESKGWDTSLKTGSVVLPPVGTVCESEQQSTMSAFLSCPQTFIWITLAFPER